MATSSELNTDWQRSAGDFTCMVCERKRLPASEFSKKQVEKALASLKTLPDKDIRTGPDIQSTTYLSAVCKRCMEEKEVKERSEAQTRRQQAAEEAGEEGEEDGVAGGAAELAAGRRVPVSLGARPFGMAPVKEPGTEGYLVGRVTAGKPAAVAAIRPGWRVAEVAGEACAGLDLEAVQALLKGAELPVQVTFEELPEGGEFCTACQRVLAASLFSRKMRTKPPDKRRCSACVEAAEAETAGGAQKEEGTAADGGDAEPSKPQSKLSELQALAAETAREAELVTGIKAVRGGGRGRRGRGSR